MTPQEDTQSPVDSVYVVLKGPSEGMTYKDAYVEAVLRHKLGTPGNRDRNDHRVGAGIYLQDGIVWEKTYVPSATAERKDPQPSPAAAERIPGVVSRPQMILSGRLATHRMAVGSLLPTQQPVISLPAPRAGYATNTNYFVPDRHINEEEGTARVYTGRLDKIVAADGYQYQFVYTARLTFHPDNSLDPVTVRGADGPKVVVHDLWLDTAASDTWVFGNLLWQEFIRLSMKQCLSNSTLQRHYEEKNMMVYPDYEPGTHDRGVLSYGVAATEPEGINRVIVKQALCAIALEHWISPLRVVDFPVGVVDAADDGHITAPFDGLLGLSRGTKTSRGSYMPAGARYGQAMTLPEAMFKQGLIRVRNFWIHIAHPTWDMPRHDFMCFSEYRNPHSGASPEWVDLDCNVQAPNWNLSLVKIVVFDSANPGDVVIDYNNRSRGVLVDTGCHLSFLRSDFYRLVRDMFVYRYQAPSGHASYACPPTLVIRFVFLSGGREVEVDGQAMRFFISPNYIEGDHPGIDIKQSERLILGLNFFRTFIVGCKDDPARPRISLAKHPDVLPGQRYISACKDVINERWLSAGQGGQPASGQEDLTRGSGPSAGGVQESDSSRGPSYGGGRAQHTAAAGPSASSAPQDPFTAPGTQRPAGHERFGHNLTQPSVPPPAQPPKNSGRSYEHYAEPGNTSSNFPLPGEGGGPGISYDAYGRDSSGYDLNRFPYARDVQGQNTGHTSRAQIPAQFAGGQADEQPAQTSWYPPAPPQSHYQPGGLAYAAPSVQPAGDEQAGFYHAQPVPPLQRTAPQTLSAFPSAQPPQAQPPPVIPPGAAPAPGDHDASSSQRRRTTSKVVVEGVKSLFGIVNDPRKPGKR